MNCRNALFSLVFYGGKAHGKRACAQFKSSRLDGEMDRFARFFAGGGSGSGGRQDCGNRAIIRATWLEVGQCRARVR
jgi:hypothetical protein